MVREDIGIWEIAIKSNSMRSGLRCPFCGYESDRTSNYCPDCGAALYNTVLDSSIAPNRISDLQFKYPRVQLGYSLAREDEHPHIVEIRWYDNNKESYIVSDSICFNDAEDAISQLLSLADQIKILNNKRRK